MALLLDYDFNSGIEQDNMYFRIDKINFNDTHFQVVATGYESEKAFRNGDLPISEPRAYTLENYNKKDIQSVFQFAYEVLKQYPIFKDAKDSLTESQKEQKPSTVLKNTEIEKSINGMRMKGEMISRHEKGLY